MVAVMRTTGMVAFTTLALAACVAAQEEMNTLTDAALGLKYHNQALSRLSDLAISVQIASKLALGSVLVSFHALR